MTPSRQLAAILFTDIAGYTAMMQEDEMTAMTVVRNYATVLKEVVGKYQGTIVNDYGDGSLCTFTSVTEAVRCAIELQRKLQAEPKVPLRVGLHVGEIFFEDGKVYGDGVNVASRIQSLGVANSILFSAEIYSKISNQSEFKSVSLGSFHFKNVSAPMEVFALANDGLKVPERSSMEGKLRPRANSLKKGIAAALVLIAASSGILYWKYLSPPNPETLMKSVAVLAFEDMSPNKDQEWFSDGISEEIINSLANLKELQVMARTSSFYFKGKDVPLAEIAEKLRVDHLVEGSVRKIDNQLRITVQLINARDGSHLFSRVYNRPDSDLFTIQSEIADSIARKLLIHLTPALLASSRFKQEVPSSSEAYAYYLRGWHARNEAIPFFLSRTWLEKLRYAEGLLLKSISLDGAYSPAYAALATLYDDFGQLRDLRERYNGLRDSVLEIGHRINPDAIGILLARALAAQNHGQPDLDSVYYHIRRAYVIDRDNPLVSYSVGAFYLRIGLADEGVAFLEKARERDPLDMSNRTTLGRIPMFLGDLDHAEAELRKMIDLDSLSFAARRNLVLVYIRKKDLLRAAHEMKSLEKMGKGLAPVERAFYLAAQGRREEALKLDRSESILSTLGMKKELLNRLDTIVLQRRFTGSLSRQVIYSAVGLDRSPIWDIIRDEPKFKLIRDRVRKDYDEKKRKYGSLN